MYTYEDPFIAEAEAQANKLLAEGDVTLAKNVTRLADCDKRVKKVEAMHRADQEHFHKAETLLAEHHAAICAPQILVDAEKLPGVELRLKIAEYDLQCKVDECKRLDAKHVDARKSEIRLKKENKKLTKTVEALTAQLEGNASPQEQVLQTENDDLKKQLALLKAQLGNKTEKCEAKDLTIANLNKDRAAKDATIASMAQDIDYLRDDFAAYQSVTSDTWIHRHDSCNELATALEEQCDMLTTQCDTLQCNLKTLEGTIGTLHHNCNSLAMERDALQSSFDESIRAHKMELEDVDTLKCEGSSGCTSCVVHLERTLRISRAAEAQALQLVDQVNHDRMVAWNQLHEHQTRVVQEHYAAVGSWVAARQAPSVSPTLVSPSFKPSQGDGNGWKISDECSSSDSGSVDFKI